jgi:hypothetical protein
MTSLRRFRRTCHDFTVPVAVSPPPRPGHERAAVGAKPRPALARAHVLTATVAARRASDPRRSNAPAPGDLPRRRRPPGGPGADPRPQFPRGPVLSTGGSPRASAGEIARPRGAPVALAALPPQRPRVLAGEPISRTLWAPLLVRPPLAHQPRDPLPAEAGHPRDHRRRLAGIAGNPDRRDQLRARPLELTLAPLDLRGGAGDRRQGKSSTRGSRGTKRA